MADSALPWLVVAYLSGLLVASLNPVHRQLTSLGLVRTISDVGTKLVFGAAPASCIDLYDGFPLSPALRIPELEESPHSPPGLAHATLSGRSHFGTRGIEVWLETLAPGAGTPIHSHDCEEVFVVLSGSGTMSIQGKDGQPRARQLAANSTLTVLTNARHQLINTGDASLTFVVAFDNPPMRPIAYATWEAAAKGRGDPLFPMWWDRQCPSRYPAGATAAMNGNAEAAGGAAAEKAEL